MTIRRTRQISVKALQALKPNQAINESLGQGHGALQARGTTKGPRFFYRYGDKQKRVPLPAFNDDGEPLSLAEARIKARALSSKQLALKAEGRDLAETLEAERLAAVEALELERRQTIEKKENRVSFGDLMKAYVRTLEDAKKPSAYDVANTLKNHIEPHSDLWRKPANEISIENVLSILVPLTSGENPKLTTARKVRAYMRRAFALGAKSERSAQAADFKKFGITSNPAKETAPIEGASNARDRALSLQELRALWRRANDPTEPAGPLLRALLLFGGQRFAQLARPKITDLRDGVLTIWDIKGPRINPRKHELPVLPEAQQALDEMRGAKLGPYLLTCTHGVSPYDYSNAQKQLAELCKRMIHAGELIATFSLGDLRRTVETRLSAAGIQRDTLAQLQSHGITGVQWKHYNRHDYMPEKRHALRTLLDLMKDPSNACQTSGGCEEIKLGGDHLEDLLRSAMNLNT